ncbi:MAG: hypothetical protein MJ055_06030 [Phascolarctobacterium sp.]|nr:hypothetical protein [Phascolarctobacterium sp.]
MGLAQKKAKEIQAELEGWELFDKLPKQVGSFEYREGTGIVGKILNICSYVNEAQHVRLDITYTDETFDFVPVKTIGLHTFREEKYYCRDRARFTEMIMENLERLIDELDREKPHAMDWEATDLDFNGWDYWKSLPKKIGDFELYITPDNPVNYINGACIFLDYVDFEHGNELYLSYNYFRNEIYGDLVKNNLPLTTPDFDVNTKLEDSKKLARLSEILEKKLVKTLEELSK